MSNAWTFSEKWNRIPVFRCGEEVNARVTHRSFQTFDSEHPCRRSATQSGQKIAAVFVLARDLAGAFGHRSAVQRAGLGAVLAAAALHRSLQAASATATVAVVVVVAKDAAATGFNERDGFLPIKAVAALFSTKMVHLRLRLGAGSWGCEQLHQMHPARGLSQQANAGCRAARAQTQERRRLAGIGKRQAVFPKPHWQQPIGQDRAPRTKLHRARAI
jgi:hypothetical protein